MNANVEVPPPPRDDDLPAASELFLKNASTRLFERFLEPRGWTFLESVVAQALYRPGRSCTVRFKVRARPTQGAERILTLCLRVRARSAKVVEPPADFGKRFGLDDPVEEIDGVTVWAFPYDPNLPGMPDAMHGPTIRESAGIRRPAVVVPTPLRYRAGQRAAIRYNVVRPEGRAETFYGKVTDEHAIQRAFDAHESYESTGIRLAEPSRPVGVGGIVLFPELAGECLRDTIEHGGSLPAPSRLIDIVEKIAAAEWVGDPDPGRADLSIRSSGRLLAFLIPHRRDEIRERYHTLMDRLREPLPQLFPVHGDLYEGQLFLDEKFRMGMIDLEDGGMGDPMIDAANMLAHLEVLHAYVPQAKGRPLAYRAMLRRELLEHMGGGDEDLAWREAYGALHLATGPFRVQSANWQHETESRLDIVGRLLDRRVLAA